MKKSEKILNQVKNDYNKIAEHFSQTRSAPWSEFTLFSEYIKEGQKILDLGCGNGRLFFSFLKDMNVEYYGLDNSEKLIGIAASNSKSQDTRNLPALLRPPDMLTQVMRAGKAMQAGKQISNPPSASLRASKFQTGEMTVLPYQDNYFDLIFCIATFHHLPTKALRLKALAEIRRVLKPGGYLLMTNWHLRHKPYLKYFFNQFSQKISWKDFFVPWKSPNGQVQCQRYYHAFSKGEIKFFFSKSGIKIEKIFLHQDPHKENYNGRGVNVVAIGRK